MSLAKNLFVSENRADSNIRILSHLGDVPTSLKELRVGYFDLIDANGDYITATHVSVGKIGAIRTGPMFGEDLANYVQRDEVVTSLPWYGCSPSADMIHLHLIEPGWVGDVFGKGGIVHHSKCKFLNTDENWEKLRSVDEKFQRDVFNQVTDDSIELNLFTPFDGTDELVEFIELTGLELDLQTFKASATGVYKMDSWILKEFKFRAVCPDYICCDK